MLLYQPWGINFSEDKKKDVSVIELPAENFLKQYLLPIKRACIFFDTGSFEMFMKKAFRDLLLFPA